MAFYFKVVSQIKWDDTLNCFNVAFNFKNNEVVVSIQKTIALRARKPLNISLFISIITKNIVYISDPVPTKLTLTVFV